MTNEDKSDKKVTITVSTLSGDYTHQFKPDTILQELVDKTVHHLELVSDGAWVLEHDGVNLELNKTVEQAGLKDGDILSLSPQEGGGGSRSK